MSNKNVLVTGGAGYIGSHTCKVLSKRGWTPVTLDSLSKGHTEAVLWGPLEQGRIEDPDRVKDVIKRHGIRSILHFAAWVEVEESVNFPLKYYLNNFEGTRRLVEVALENGVEQFVFSSTAAVYGEPDREVIDESQALQPINPYGWSKLMAEQLLKDVHRASQLSVAVLRYFNASGADFDGEVGSYHPKPTHLIPRVLEVALGKREKISVFGDDYPTKDGTCVRDFIHVMDLAEAHVKALEYLENEKVFEIFNLGSQSGQSVLEIIEASRAISGHKIPLEIASRRPGDPSALIADSSKAQSKLSWKAEHSSANEIIQSAWDWMNR